MASANVDLVRSIARLGGAATSLRRMADRESQLACTAGRGEDAIDLVRGLVG
jgi:hypothetical protein